MGEYVTLAQTRLLTGDDVDRTVIDEFVKNGGLLARIPFHRAAAVTGGNAAAYTYTRLVTQPDAAFRALGSDYTRSVADVTQITVVCSVLGGSFGIDRVLAALGGSDQVLLQVAQKIKGAQARFADTVINGDVDSDPNAFDGLSVALTGSDTEVDGSSKDWSDLSTQAAAFAVLDDLDNLLSEVDGSEGLVIMTNKKGALRIASAARVAGYKTSSEDAAGRLVNSYAGVPILDLGATAGSNDPIVPVTDGTTDIYVARLAQDGFHAVSPDGAPIVKTYLPNPDTANGASVLTGAVEMVATVALKSTKAAAVLRGVQIDPVVVS